MGRLQFAEIDPDCLTDSNFGPLRLLLEVNERLEIPYEVHVSARFGGVARVMPIRVWDRSDQLDDDGNLTPFFRHGPAPPPPGPQQGPPAPFGREQQRQPPQHPTNRRFPPPALDAVMPARDRAVNANPAHVLGLALALARCLLNGANQHFVLEPSRSTVSSPGLPVPDEGGQELQEAVPASSPPHASSVFSFDFVTPPVADAAPPGTPRAARAVSTRPRHRRADATSLPPSRHSARIAERTKGAFVNVPNQAVRRKALVNALAGCSSALKKQVTKRNILTRNKIPMSAKEIRKLVSAATAGCSSAASVGVVTDVAE